LAAAMERLAERRGAELLAAAENLPEGRERLVQGLDLLWASYANPLFQAALDLWSHARTDPDLRERLVPVERRLDRQTLEITKQLFAGIAEQPDFDRLVELAVSTIRGLALLDTLHPGDGRNRKQWRYSRARLVELFEGVA
jgi:BetI-type transcriptional repressor, C-terminal